MQDQSASGIIKRGEFLRELGLSSSALLAFYCMGTLSSCSKSSDPQPAAPAPGTGTTPTGLTGNAETSKGKINFTLDLTSSTFKTLKTVGNYVTQGDIIVAYVKGSKYVALNKACTHQGTTVEYQVGVDNFYCPNHGSRFTDSGTVLNGPATGPLKLYSATLSADGNSLVIAE